MNIFNPNWYFRVGEVVYKEKSIFGPRRQMDLQLVYLYSGNLEISVEGERYHLQPGEVTLLIPGKTELFHFARQTETYHGWCSAHLNHYDEGLLERLAHRPDRLPMSDFMRQLATQSLKLRGETAAGIVAYRDSLIQSMFCEFFSRCSTVNVESSVRHPAVERACAYMDLQFDQPLNLVEISSHAGVTQTHLTRLFRSSVGQTPIRYLWKLRIQRAMQLLSETGLTVAEVSDRSGFTNPQHFSKLFKSEHGTTPGQYRAAAWGRGG